eukprot:NODE_3416_length_557_cov_31.555118_g2883_i0.p2 GENE.NODE_3416_length_557_cov_31.555118_g2883_i0~~NODE_3416_length_557_cov_31.555118_g2883_i0.p2  ORF type:complete len:151 (-),score=45.81 NODE_3416_length_557_cov_31.555118_g2883_i0:105-497(-)
MRKGTENCGLLAGFVGFTGVALGAFGAHALKKTLTQRNMLTVWETAVQYHLVHGVALLGCWAAMQSMPDSTSLVTASKCWGVGTLLFSGSLYGLALGAPRWFGPITPLGGLLLLGGWASIGYAAMAAKRD